jgi:hypothetical protein
MHPPHMFVTVLQMPIVPAGHWLFIVHWTHVLVAVLHTGLAGSVQWPSMVHSTHMLVAGLQAGVGATQRAMLVAVHTTQAPDVALHAGVVRRPLQSASTLQDPHVFVDELHTGWFTGQLAFVRHATHVFVAVLQ